jgi:NAD+ synthase
MIDKKFVITEENAAEYIQRMGEFIRNAVEGAHRQGVVLGMSGGIDCSVVARLCQEAGVYVKLLLLPDNSDMTKTSSHRDAMELIEKFDFPYEIYDIGEACRAVDGNFDEMRELSQMNVRPRMRMIFLYTAAQNESLFVIGTSNLDERLLGYFTKWGDGASDLNPLGMLTKGEIRLLARHLDLPEGIISKPASAGLFEGQTDEDDLGVTYAQMDAYILEGTSGSPDADQIIQHRIAMSRHKLEPIRIFLG